MCGVHVFDLFQSRLFNRVVAVFLDIQALDNTKVEMPDMLCGVELCYAWRNEPASHSFAWVGLSDTQFLL